MDKIKLKKLLLDIRFWIILLFVLRLIGIMNAPLEIGHNWRQSLTNMIARNFLEFDSNIFYPAIDMAGNQTGIIGTEFPLFNYLIYLCSEAFGYTHWYGRLINLLVSSFGIYYFYQLLKHIYNERVAFNSTLIFAVSIWFAFSRKIMPDTFSVALVIIGLYYAYTYLKDAGKRSLVLFFVFCTLGMLCKIPALSIFSVLGVVLLFKQVTLQRKIVLLTTATFSFLVVCIWYFYWVPYLLDTYQYQLYFPKGLVEGFREILPLIPELLEKFYFSALHSYVALICVFVGGFFLLKRKKKFTILGLGIITAVFILFIVKTGAVFPTHNYYVVPYVPIMAFLAGYGITQLPSKYQYFLLVLIVVEGVSNQQHDFRVRDSELYKLELESITQKLIPQKDLIIINGGRSPQDIYFSHRKGWSIYNDDLNKQQLINSFIDLGAKYLIINIDRLGTEPFKTSHELIHKDKNYLIYKLTN